MINEVREVISVRVTVVRPGDLGPDEASLWARFQKSLPELQNPFFSLTFAQVVDRHRPNARVAVVEDDGRIQGFLAFEMGPGRMGVAGWPGASQPRAPTERSVKVSLYSARPIYRLNLNSVDHFQCANRSGCLSVRPFHHLRTFLYDLSRLYFRFAQRTR